MPIEIRTTDTIHDRHVITRDRVWMLGGSLNGLGKQRATAITEIRDAGDPIRQQYEACGRTRRFSRSWCCPQLMDCSQPRTENDPCRL